MKQLSGQVKIKREHGFNIVSFVVTVFLMLSFLGAIMYVLISSM